MSGTDIAYCFCPTSFHVTIFWVGSRVWCYAIATRCPVLFYSLRTLTRIEPNHLKVQPVQSTTYHP
eukprot:2437366-Rhodomonas_salina.1